MAVSSSLRISSSSCSTAAEGAGIRLCRQWKKKARPTICRYQYHRDADGKTQVLCLVPEQITFLAREPMLPPKIAARKRVFSEIRQRPRRAFHLSMPISASARRLISTM